MTKLMDDVVVVGAEILPQKSLHILKKEGLRPYFPNRTDGMRKHIPIIPVPSVLATQAEGLARWSARDEVHLTGKSAYEIRKAVLKNRDFWETQCDSWQSQRPRDTAFLEYLDRLNAEIVENCRNREAERNKKHHQNLPTDSTTESRTTLLEQSRSVSTTPRNAQHGRKGRETMPVPGSTKYDHLEHLENRRQRRLEPMQPKGVP